MDHRIINTSQIPKATLTELLLWLVGKRKRYSVTGDSMEPVLKEGDVVLVMKSEVSVGDIVVLQHPFKNKVMVKQVEEIKDGQVKVVGLNSSESEDSRGFGDVDTKHILGSVVSRL